MGHDNLGWCFFEEKNTSSSRVLHASSVYNWPSKLVTMNMEVWRRMHNSTRQLTPGARAEIMCTFVTKLRESGCVESSVSGIIRLGLAFYARKLHIDLQGGPPVNQRSEKDSLQRDISWGCQSNGSPDRGEDPRRLRSRNMAGGRRVHLRLRVGRAIGAGRSSQSTPQCELH